MKRAIVTVLAVGCIAGGVAAMGAMGVGSFVEDRLVSLMLPQSFFPYRCTEGDKRFASSLATLGILDAHPAGAKPYEERDGGCNDDDRLAYAGQSYRISGSRADALSFYRKAVIKDGWKPAPKDMEGCLVKAVGGRKVYLSMGFPDVPREKGLDEYYVQVNSTADGGGLC
ncbi:hypothetical protein [Streptosporangium sp. 'caverna']|uniref:hypothetical protein n=1 Tax=Streptosporangium sp. 'caverna' TaxID=2202249 RepID=UPI000D7D2A44|nr:hypothetical protein [Streptosporangium sp. 'caverna']AWS42518.1 hypothetical protein DKM19_15300 [Streptosporangium sp. 'caverna']